jgi:23S rRNA (adenine2503-C2)-methyltransferase
MNSIDKIELLGMNMEELENFAASLGQPRFRGRQLHRWIYVKDTSSFYEMSDIPREIRQQLDERARVSIPRVLKQRVASDGTRKFLMEMYDKKRVETVLIPQSANLSGRYTLCVSSQVGCPLRCAFCATGQGVFQRNLYTHEIVGQLLGSRRELKRRLKNPEEPLITNVVFMGMGEPLLNYNEVIRAIRILNDPRGIQLGQRHITISTCGEAAAIKRLAEENLQVTLAISLHAASDQLRNELVPINKKYPLQTLMAAVKTYTEKTGRRVTFEYILLDGVNISRKDAENLAKLVKPLLANVNLIPYNEVDGLNYRKPQPQDVTAFYNWLNAAGLNVSVREEHGVDIEAACGQLAVKPN